MLAETNGGVETAVGRHRRRHRHACETKTILDLLLSEVCRYLQICKRNVCV